MLELFETGTLADECLSQALAALGLNEKAQSLSLDDFSQLVNRASDRASGSFQESGSVQADPLCKICTLRSRLEELPEEDQWKEDSLDIRSTASLVSSLVSAPSEVFDTFMLKLPEDRKRRTQQNIECSGNRQNEFRVFQHSVSDNMDQSAGSQSGNSKSRRSLHNLLIKLKRLHELWQNIGGTTPAIASPPSLSSELAPVGRPNSLRGKIDSLYTRVFSEISDLVRESQESCEATYEGRYQLLAMNVHEHAGFDNFDKSETSVQIDLLKLLKEDEIISSMRVSEDELEELGFRPAQIAAVFSDR